MASYIHIHPQLSYIARAFIAAKEFGSERRVILDSGPSLIGSAMTDNFLHYMKSITDSVLGLRVQYLMSHSWLNTANPGIYRNKSGEGWKKQYWASVDSLIRMNRYRILSAGIEIERNEAEERALRLYSHYRRLFSEYDIDTAIFSHGNYDTYVCGIQAALDSNIKVFVLHAGMHYNLSIEAERQDIMTYDPWCIARDILESLSSEIVDVKRKLLAYGSSKLRSLPELNYSTFFGAKSCAEKCSGRIRAVIYCHAHGDAASRYTYGDRGRCFTNSWDWLIDTLEHLEDSDRVVIQVRLHPQTENFGEKLRVLQLVEKANQSRRYPIEIQNEHLGSGLAKEDPSIAITNHGYITIERAAYLQSTTIQAGPGSFESKLECVELDTYRSMLGSLSDIPPELLRVERDKHIEAAQRLTCEHLLKTNTIYGRQMNNLNRYYNFQSIQMLDALRLSRLLGRIEGLFTCRFEHRKGSYSIMV